MKDIKRIKEIMDIREDKIPRTAPINTQNLVRIIQMTVNNLNGEIDFDNLNPDSEIIDEIGDNLKFIGVKSSWEILDYIYAFCKENFVQLSNQKYDYTEYIIPQKKKFQWRVDEQFRALVTDTYVGTQESYSVEFLRNEIENEGMDHSYGDFVNQEFIDTWDTEWNLMDIKEVPIKD